MSTGLIDVEALEREVETCKGLIAADPTGVKHAIAVARAIGIAKRYVQAMMPHLVQLQGSTLGFQTDKLYTEQELVNPLTEAAIIGLPFTGNCCNVIGKNLYIPVGGWEHRFANSDRVSWPSVKIGTVEITEESHWMDLPAEKHYVANGRKITGRTVPGMSRVETVGICTCDGVDVRVEFLDHRATGGLDERIIVRVNAGMGEDAIITKARRKTLKSLWIQALGQSAGPVGTEDDDTITVKPERTTVETVDPNAVTLDQFKRALADAADGKALAAVAAEMADKLPEADKPAGRDAYAARRADLRAASDGAMGDRP